MHIRNFRAANLQAALADIRRQMGPSASVLHTRQVRDGWWGWLGRTQVEVTAGLRDEDAVVGHADASASHADVEATVISGRVDARALQSAGITGRIPPSPRPAPYDDLPAVLQAYRDELQCMGVPAITARQWIESTASFNATLGDEHGGLSWLEQLQGTVARGIRLAGPIRTQPGERHVVALIGPTGVGKTTTVAKLAAGFRIESRRRVGLLTIDTYRIAAVEQLRAYAQIMDLPMEVVEQPREMRSALDRLGDVDLVLIDTAGRSPRGEARIEQLTQFLHAAQPDETHLVLSATSSPESIRMTLSGFAPTSPTAAILTKLDEAPHTAGILAALETGDRSPVDRFQVDRMWNLPISYITDGQQVPEDISVADANRLVRGLLPVQGQGTALAAA